MSKKWNELTAKSVCLVTALSVAAPQVLLAQSQIGQRKYTYEIDNFLDNEFKNEMTDTTLLFHGSKALLGAAIMLKSREFKRVQDKRVAQQVKELENIRSSAIPDAEHRVDILSREVDIAEAKVAVVKQFVSDPDAAKAQALNKFSAEMSEIGVRLGTIEPSKNTIDSLLARLNDGSLKIDEKSATELRAMLGDITERLGREGQELLDQKARIAGDLEEFVKSKGLPESVVGKDGSALDKVFADAEQKKAALVAARAEQSKALARAAEITKNVDFSKSLLNKIKLFGLRSVAAVGGAVLFVDAVGGLYVATSLEKDPTISPLRHFSYKTTPEEMEKVVRQLIGQ